MTCWCRLSSLEREDTKLSTVNWQSGTEEREEGVSITINSPAVMRGEAILCVIVYVQMETINTEYCTNNLNVIRRYSTTLEVQVILVERKQNTVYLPNKTRQRRIKARNYS